MGKRKSRTCKPAPRKVPKLDTVFACPFCGHPDAVDCLIEVEVRYKYAKLKCSVCMETFVTGAHALTAPVDVYAEWIDACEEANEGVVVRSCRPGRAMPETKKTLCHV